MKPEIKFENDKMKDVLINEVITREIFEGEKVIEAKKKISKFYKDYTLKLNTTKDQSDTQ